jgi:hypothetical protein
MSRLRIVLGGPNIASGRPVLAEDSGFSDHLPTGEGLLAFRDLEKALAGRAEMMRTMSTTAGSRKCPVRNTSTPAAALRRCWRCADAKMARLCSRCYQRETPA